jgi:hypothetical protein
MTVPTSIFIVALFIKALFIIKLEDIEATFNFSVYIFAKFNSICPLPML